MSEYIIAHCVDSVSGVRYDERRDEIVRCRDCKHFEEIEGLFKWCSFHNMDVEEHDFCSKGERRDRC